jgi:hypothetical protein
LIAAAHGGTGMAPQIGHRSPAGGSASPVKHALRDPLRTKHAATEWNVRPHESLPRPHAAYTPPSFPDSQAFRMGDRSEMHVLDGRTSSHELTHSTLRASRTLDLDGQLLQFILATDAGVVDQLLGHRAVLDPESTQGLRALRLVRLHRALGDVFGTAERVQRFLDTELPELGDTPRHMLATTDGVERVLSVVERDVRDSLDPRFHGTLQQRPDAA